MPFSRSSSRSAAIISAFIPCVPFSSAPQSTTVRADAIRGDRDRASCAVDLEHDARRRRAATRAPVVHRAPSTGAAVFTFTCAPDARARTARAFAAAARCRASSPRARSARRRSPRGRAGGRSSRRAPRSCRGRARRRSTVTRRVRVPPLPPKETSTSSKPAPSTTGRTSDSASTTTPTLLETKGGRAPTSGQPITTRFRRQYSAARCEERPIRCRRAARRVRGTRRWWRRRCPPRTRRTRRRPPG